MNIKVNNKGEACFEAGDIYLRAAKKEWPGISDEAANIIARWYRNEDAADDYPKVDDLASHMNIDLADMIWAADDKEDVKIVCDATGEDNPFEEEDESKQDEASSTGNLKGRKKVMDAINRGYIFEALDVAHEVTEAALNEVDQADEALKGCKEKLEQLDDLRTKLNEIGAVALRTSIANLYSPEHARDAARDKMLKDAIKMLYEIFGDLDAGREMVLTYTSSLATNAKRALLQNKNAVEVTMGDLKENGLEGDSKELVTFTSAKSRQANAGMAKTLGPVIDQAKAVAQAAGTAADATVPAAEYQKLLDKLNEMYENASRITMVITTTPDFQPSDVIRKLKTAPEESKFDEGFLDKLVDMFKKLASGLSAAFASLKQQFTSLFSDVEAANDVYATTSELMMSMGFPPISVNLPAAVDSEDESFAGLFKKLGEAFSALESHPDYCTFADEVYLAQASLGNVREAMQALADSLGVLKGLASQPVNEGNMEVVGILADAINKIANDAAETEAEAEAEAEGPSVADQVSQTYGADDDTETGAPDRDRTEEPGDEF